MRAQLRPWQKTSVEHLVSVLRSGKNALDASDGGVGKTYVACAVSAALGKNTLAIVPKISVSAWHSVAEGFGAPVQAIGYEALRTGQTNFGTWENSPPANGARETFFVCQICQRRVTLEAGDPGCPHHPNSVHCLVTKKKPWVYGKFSFSPEVEFLLVDEVHRCSALDSLNSDMLCAAKRQNIPTLAMSATAACGPLQLRALGYLLGLHGLDWAGTSIPNWKTWCHRQGCRYDPNFHGLIWNQPEERKQKILRDIRSDIFPSQGVRVSTAEVPGFPKRIITAETYDIDKGPGPVDKLYAEMAESLNGLTVQAADDASPDHPLTKLLRARQKLELLKVPIAVELAQDEIAKGRSVAIFVNFTQTIEELAKKFKTRCVTAIIKGGQNDITRQSNIALFQDNDAPLILANSAAGGVSVSLHDVHGDHPRTGLVMPSHSAVQMLQVFFRLAREGGKSTAIYKVLLAAGTVERKIQKAFESKRDCIESLNDGDLNPHQI